MKNPKQNKLARGRLGMVRLGGLLLVGGLIAMAVSSFAPGVTQAATYASQLTRYPYLTDVVAGSATINFATDQSQNSATVKYGTPPNCTANTVVAIPSKFVVFPSPYYGPTSTNGVNEWQWRATLTGLQPATTYCYRVYLGTNPVVDLLGSGSTSPAFTTLPAPGAAQAFSFAVIGSTGYVDTTGANSNQAALLKQLASSQGLSFVVSTGDTAITTEGYAVSPTPVPTGQPTPIPTPSAVPTPLNPPLQTQYGDLYQVGPSTSGFFGPSFWTQVGATLPFFAAPGNHGFSTPFLTNFPQNQAVSTSNGRYLADVYPPVNGTIQATYPSAWYAFDVANVRIYVLTAAWADNNLGTATAYQNDHDTHWTTSSMEYQWLQADLAAHPNSLKFAFFHYPIYSDGVYGSNTYLQGPTSLEGLLSQYGVAIGFSGYSHIYERNIKPNTNSLITYEVGAGGAPLDPVGGLYGKNCSPYNAYAIGWIGGTRNQGTACGSATPPATPQEVYSFLVVSVNGSKVTVTPTNSLGQTFDVQTYDFGPSVVPTPPIPVTGGISIFLPQVMH